MEFKGTKGKWELKGKYITTPLEDVCKVFCWDDKEDQTNGTTVAGSILSFRANALLISKAPEMLDMLKSFVNDFDNGLIDDFQIPRDRFEQLIKEATEI